ncbi:MAG TPA: hypothetical protein VGQ86_03970 [Candidatus Limnocylindria bacterium]|jgi:anti-sigma factor RsiW|nr:hypothetical protein [Candidatus Limnocylindria bacterium]
MKIFSVSCRSAEQKMAELFTGELAHRERVELESHAARCAHCDGTLRDLATISVALDRAYAPLRQETTALSPARVRLVTRPDREVAVPWWRSGLIGRFSEATLALGFAALAIGGSLDLARPATVDVTPPSVIRDYFRAQPPSEETAYLRWLRFQLRTVTGDPGPIVRYPVGGQFDVEQIAYGDGRLDGPR